jgi:hypothetical protein
MSSRKYIPKIVIKEVSSEPNWVDFAGYEPEDVLQALIDQAITGTEYMKVSRLEPEYMACLLEREYIQFTNGRYLGVTFKKYPLIDSTTYDKYNGAGAMESALQLLYNRTNV